ncbi:MAG: HesA/MoeB/ThiF family protein [Desulfobacteraceae bacterium]|nr:HesA/MoeB/ThiF family protein [Desulfobacteraceae bacterium]
MPDGDSRRILTVEQTEQIAAQYSVSIKNVEINALQNQIAPLRYTRNFKTYSFSEQISLLKSRITVIGLGGLGGNVVEILARSGIGAIDIADGDIFEDHNLNRQLCSTRDLLGVSKIKAAASRIKSINDAVDVTIHDYPMTEENVAGLIEQSQLVMDCLDSIPARFTLETGAKRMNLPMVSAAVAGLTGHITTIFPKDKGLSLIYGAAETRRLPKGAETTLGSLPQTVTMTAAIESSEALKIILGKTGNLLRNKLMVIDLENNMVDVLKLV